MILLRASVLALLFIVGIAEANENSIERPFEKASWEYYQTLLSRNFDDLERVAERSRKSNATISDGQPRLAAVYGGLAGCLSNGCRNRLSEEQWQERQRLLLVWQKSDSRSITAEIANAAFFVEHAWAIRGGGYAHTVREEAWRAFRENVEIARKMLQEARPAVRDDPQWYASMLDIGVSQGWPAEQFGRLYKEARKKYPLYLPIYFHASAYFSPRWYGSVPELRAFIDESVDATRPQLGETLYARLNWALWTRDMFVNGQADWSRMKAGFERMVADYPDPWNLNNFAKFACIAGDKKTLIDLMKSIGPRPIESAWGRSLQYFNHCVAFAQQNR